MSVKTHLSLVSRRDTTTYRRTGPVRCSAFQSRQANIKASLCTVFLLWTTTPIDYTYNRSVTTKVTQRSLIRKSSFANRSRSKLPGLRAADSQTKANKAHSDDQFGSCDKTVSGRVLHLSRKWNQGALIR